MAIGEQIGRGRTAEVFAWGRHEVVKLFYDSGLAAREARNMEAVVKLGIRTPRLTKVIEHDGRAGLVMERLQGQTLLQQLSAAPEEALRCAEVLADLHVQRGQH